MRTRIRARIFLSAAVLAGMLASACQKQEVIRIGFVGGLTGRNGDLGVAGRDGTILAVETINAGGGIRGKKIELVVRDDKSDAEEAKKVVSGLVSEKVTAIVGPMTSVVAAAAIPIVNDARTLMLSPTVSSGDFSGKDDYFIRLNLNWDTAAASADAEVGKLHITKAALVYDVANRSYTGSLAAAFRKRFTELGGTIVDEKSFNAKEQVDLLALARQVAARKPPSIFIMAGAVDSAIFCQQLRKLGARSAIFIGEWASTPEFLKSGGKAVEGVHILEHYNTSSAALAFKTFRDAFLKRFGDQPNFASAYSYEAVMIIADALGKDPDPGHLKDSIIGIGKFNGLQGTIAIDRFGDPVRPYTAMHVVEGRFVPEE